MPSVVTVEQKQMAILFSTTELLTFGKNLKKIIYRLSLVVRVLYETTGNVRKEKSADNNSILNAFFNIGNCYVSMLLIEQNITICVSLFIDYCTKCLIHRIEIKF